MSTAMFEVMIIADQEYVVLPDIDPADRIEEDGVDWCAWWAEYVETLE